MVKDPIKLARRKYKGHIAHAEKRKIEFLLIFEEWLKIWMDSGHWHERGSRRGKYVMARFGDKGPYAMGNVKIILHEDNSRERKFKFNDEQKAYLSAKALGREVTAETRKKISEANTGRKQSDETKLKKHFALLGKNKGKIHSNEIRQKMSISKIGNRGNPSVFIDYLGNLMNIRRAVYAAGNIVTVECAIGRLKRGWPHREAIEMPVGSRKNDCPSYQLG